MSENVTDVIIKRYFNFFLFFGKHLSISGVAVDSYKD